MQESEEKHILLDRLVDDELSASERERLLASIEQQNGWRDCALAFLENQTWRREMKSLVRPSIQEKTLPPADTRPDARQADSRVLSFMALAAGLLIAFSLGWLTRPGGTAEDLQHQLAAGDIEQVPEPKVADKPPAIRPELDDHDVVTLLVRDDQGQANRLRVPLVELAGADQEGETSVGTLPDAFVRQLQRRGMDLRGRRRYAPFFIEQNEQVVPMAVPVDDAYVVPVSRPVL